MIPQLRRVLLAFTMIASVLFGLASPAAAHHPEIEASVVCTSRGYEVTYTATAWETKNADRRHNNSVEVEINGQQSPGGRFNAENNYSFTETVGYSGNPGDVLTITVTTRARWGVEENKGGINDSRSTTVTLPTCEDPGEANVTAQINVLCNDEAPGTVYIQAVITNSGDAVGEYLFASDNGAGPDISPQSGTLDPLTSVTLYGYPDALGSGTVFVRDGIVPGSSNSVIARASFDSDDCVDITDPTIEFKCVDEGRVAVAFNTDGADITEVRVNGEVVAHDGDLVVNSGDKVEVTTALGGQTATASAVAPECDEIGLQEPLIKFFCVGEDLVQWSVQNPNNFGELTVWVGGVETDATSGTIASGTEVQAVVNADGNFGPVQSDMADARAEECPPENEAVEATVEFLCVSPTEVAYTVTSDAFGLAVSINGEDVFPSGIVPVGTEITVTTYTEAMYSDELIVWTETYTAPECAPEATPEVTISTVCNADLTARDYTVTAPEGSTIVSVKVNGVTVGTSGTVYAGDVITVVASTASVYNDAEVITETFSMTVGDCELPVTGSTTATLLSMAGVLLIAGASLLLVRRKLA